MNTSKNGKAFTTYRAWHALGRASVRVLRREAAVKEAQDAGRAAYYEERLAAQARRQMKRIARRYAS